MSLEPGAPPVTPGRLLRTARESQGVHIAVLAAALKVPPRKLEALEGDRFEELGDATFVRALAQSVCSVLHVDPQPVLERLPRVDPRRLERLDGSLNAPFRDRPSHHDSPAVVWAQRLLVGGGAALLLAALFTYFVPSNWFEPDTAVAPSATAPAASAPDEAPASMPGQAAQPSSAVPSSTPASALPPASPTPAAAATPAPVAATSALPGAPGRLRLSAIGTSWVEVRDLDGRVLLSRTLRSGEVVDLDSQVPMRAVIGNAAAVEVLHRGKPVPLGPATSSNVARLELP